MADEENIEVEVAPPDQDGITVVSESEPNAPEPNLSDDLADFKRRYEDEKAARMDAERRYYEAQQQAHRASNEVDDTNLRLVEGAINTVRTEASILKAQYRDAMTLNDYDRAAEIQEAMSLNSAKLLQLENGKQAMESRPRQAAPAAPPSDPVESFARQLSPQSAKWIRENPQYVTNPRLNQKMIAAHNLAMADGIEADTPDYFDYVENILGVRKSSTEAAEAPMSAASAPTQRRSAPPAAPVSRNSNPGTTRVVRLTADQREMASLLGMTPEEYARHRVALVKEGKIVN